jgi:group I intron endonuclease
MHYLYKITNMINQKVYIGQTITPDKRWYEHKRFSHNPKFPLHCSIKSHGEDNFQFEVIATCLTLDDSNWAEEELIKQYDCLIVNGKGYNIAKGGDNHKHSEETKKKMSLARKGKPSNRKGVKLSKEIIDKMIKSRQGYTTSEETKKKLSIIAKKQIWISNRALHISQSLRKLTPDQEQDIKNDNRSSRILGKIYGVNQKTILNIKNNVSKGGHR